jgi:hypothetical protein
MAGYTCPFCQHIMSISNNTHQTRYPCFPSDRGTPTIDRRDYITDTIQLDFYKCPNCEKTSITLIGVGKQMLGLRMHIYPNSSAKQFPEYIPQPIRDDYTEACAIVNISPKASATLSRRCLQGMIHDFWDIKLKTLNQEISALKSKIAPDLWEAIDSLRQLGNIGAHMESDTNIILDIDPEEAQSLIKLIELLMKEWYINREDRRKLFSGILSANTSKQDERKRLE